MAIGRVHVGPGDGVAGVLERVAGLLRPLGLDLVRAPDAERVREAVGYEVWQLVALDGPVPGGGGGAPAPPAPRSVAEGDGSPAGAGGGSGEAVTYRLEPQEDITALELARLLAVGGWGLKVTAVVAPELELRLGDLLRHTRTVGG